MEHLIWKQLILNRLISICEVAVIFLLKLSKPYCEKLSEIPQKVFVNVDGLVSVATLVVIDDVKIEAFLEELGGLNQDVLLGARFAVTGEESQALGLLFFIDFNLLAIEVFD